MTNRIMQLAGRWRTANYAEREETREALTTEVQAHIDYTRAVIAERDALKAELERKAQYGKEWMDKYLELRKAAQMALENLDAGYVVVPASAVHKALRKELT